MPPLPIAPPTLPEAELKTLERSRDLTFSPEEIKNHLKTLHITKRSELQKALEGTALRIARS